MSKDELSENIEKIVLSLNTINMALANMQKNEEVEQIRVLLVQREELINRIKLLNVLKSISDDNEQNIHEMLQIIRHSSDGEEAEINLTNKYSISISDAQMILSSPLNDVTQENNKSIRKELSDELSLLEEQLHNNPLYRALDDYEIEIIKKSADLKTSLMEIFPDD